MKNYDKTGGEKGKPGYRTPSWFKGAPKRQGGFKGKFRKPSI